ncbi:MAG: BLUF domain-containing protein [Pseudomonadota bacterium]|nr:BLUF domain-containing protein [Pseudomonadota bacterium]
MSNLIRMVYASTSSNPIETDNGAVPRDVGRILMQSRKNNPSRQLGGVLYFSNNFFFQCLEGDQQEIDHLYRKLADDPRHTHLQTLSVKRVQQRLFSDWSMKYVALDHQVQQILRQHGQNRFNPYEFNEAMIDSMLGLFVRARDITAGADQQHTSAGAIPRPGLLSRLFGRKRAA